MLKLIFLAGLVYLSYRLFIAKGLKKGDKQQELDEKDEYADYEEIE